MLCARLLGGNGNHHAGVTGLRKLEWESGHIPVPGVGLRMGQFAYRDMGGQRGRREEEELSFYF